MSLLAGLVDVIVNTIAALGYAGLAAMMALESMLAPVPSEVVMPFAGYLVWQGRFGFAQVLAAALVGSLVGSLLSYYIGYYGGRPLVVRYGKWLLLGEKEIAWTDAFFARRGAVAVLAARFIPIVRHLISIPAGAARMPLLPFLAATALGAFAWNALLAWLGLQLGPRWGDVRESLAPYENALLVLAVLAVLGFIAWKLRAANRRAAGKA